ncbi:BCN_G0031540.mRNA.1.CDS.1 [Saccharomyces cerevisiae]|nr:BFP_1a_G0030450.mRNA.1.CDS.1 [Saccharomyces cerevisiae]CAI4562186.1 BCN_G0031540.mRNA.1.CDS.1 [Saccharomyces cerevisiae]CAI4573335.1 ADE_G0030350.mRNA.1.CDS.1 [Saccharomyces cerevisiae]CAI5281696.1 ALI_HP2_G0025610.mRNA.1.CDS.1 [Saccharomyces cerevisiae]CAI6552618.1 ALI_HP2_G0025610.mRNA.1.CDS.1 [Saccharomyces cerevisiae]
MSWRYSILTVDGSFKIFIPWEIFLTWNFLSAAWHCSLGVSTILSPSDASMVAAWLNSTESNTYIHYSTCWGTSDYTLNISVIDATTEKLVDTRLLTTLENATAWINSNSIDEDEDDMPHATNVADRLDGLSLSKRVYSICHYEFWCGSSP